MMESLHRRVVDEESLLDLMGRASREAVRLLDDAHWAGVTAQFAGTPFTAAHTDHRVLVVDEGQYGEGDGPCLTAMRIDRRVAMNAGEVNERWPDLAVVAAGVGVRAYLASPLHVREHAVGSLNLYSGRPEGLRTPDPDVLTVLTEYLDRGLNDYSASRPGEDKARRLRQRLRDRQTIDTAVGMLMALHPLTAQEAADLLDLRAAQQDLPVTQVAADLIAEHTPNRPPSPPAGSD